MKLKELKANYINRRVIYTKQGQKEGWTGTVTKIFAKQGNRFTVVFDNGIEQDYRMDALHHQQKSWGSHNTYIELIKVN
jgi:hypothetical protein